MNISIHGTLQRLVYQNRTGFRTSEQFKEWYFLLIYIFILLRLSLKINTKKHYKIILKTQRITLTEINHFLYGFQYFVFQSTLYLKTIPIYQIYTDILNLYFFLKKRRFIEKKFMNTFIL